MQSLFKVTLLTHCILFPPIYPKNITSKGSSRHLSYGETFFKNITLENINPKNNSTHLGKTISLGNTTMSSKDGCVELPFKQVFLGKIIVHSPRNVLEMQTCSHKELKHSLGTWLHFHGSMAPLSKEKMGNITNFCGITIVFFWLRSSKTEMEMVKKFDHKISQLKWKGPTTSTCQFLKTIIDMTSTKLGSQS